MSDENQVIEGVVAISPDNDNILDSKQNVNTRTTITPPTSDATEVEKSGSKDDKVSNEQEIQVKPLEKPKVEETPKLSSEDLLYSIVSDVVGSESGEITEEHLKALEGSGFTEKTLSSLVNATKQERKANDAAVFELVGGKDVYIAMADYAVKEYSDEELAAYNKALKSGDKQLARLAILGLKSDYEQKGKPKEPSGRIQGSTGAITKDKFADRQELISAMRNRKYGRDPIYTKEVDAKRAASPW